MGSERPLVVWGPTGVGKSTVAAMAATRVGRPLVDVDREVEAALGATIAEVFAARGEAVFREAERGALRAALARADAPIIAVGGGALVDDAARGLALERAAVVTLTARADVLAARLAGTRDRPLLGANDEERSARLGQLLAERRAAYDAGALRLDVSDATIEHVVDRVAAAARDVFTRVSADSWVRHTSDAFSATRDLAGGARATRVLFVTDETVGALYGDRMVKALDGAGATPPIVLPPGEGSKRLATVEHLAGEFAARGADRRSIVVALGGGALTDVVGFAAAVYMRGIRWIAVPTTTLGMVDAAIGGKTAVDLDVRKNVVGAFHLPMSTIVDPSFARTETPRARASGLAEVIKSLVLGDVGAFEAIERATVVDAEAEGALREAIARAAAVKAAIVGRDPHERGERVVLNFGHTFGHAIEAHGGLDRWTHGEAVAIGMVLASRLGEHLGVTPPSVTARIVTLLARVGLPTTIDAEALVAAASFVSADKKRDGGDVRFVLLEDVGRPVVRSVALDTIRPLIQQIRS